MAGGAERLREAGDRVEAGQIADGGHVELDLEGPAVPEGSGADDRATGLVVADDRRVAVGGDVDAVDAPAQDETPAPQRTRVAFTLEPELPLEQVGAGGGVRPGLRPRGPGRPHPRAGAGGGRR